MYVCVFVLVSGVLGCLLRTVPVRGPRRNNLPYPMTREICPFLALEKSRMPQLLAHTASQIEYVVFNSLHLWPLQIVLCLSSLHLRPSDLRIVSGTRMMRNVSAPACGFSGMSKLLAPSAFGIRGMHQLLAPRPLHILLFLSSWRLRPADVGECLSSWGPLLLKYCLGA